MVSVEAENITRIGAAISWIVGAGKFDGVRRVGIENAFRRSGCEEGLADHFIRSLPAHVEQWLNHGMAVKISEAMVADYVRQAAASEALKVWWEGYE